MTAPSRADRCWDLLRQAAALGLVDYEGCYSSRPGSRRFYHVVSINEYGSSESHSYMLSELEAFCDGLRTAMRPNRRRSLTAEQRQALHEALSDITSIYADGNEDDQTMADRMQVIARRLGLPGITW